MPHNTIQAIAFDADDTLWDCQSHFESVERTYCKLLSEYGDSEHISGNLFKTEAANMELLGYGTKAFTLSLIENAVSISGGKVSASVIDEIIKAGKSLLRLPATPLPGVRETLAAISEMRRYRLALFTKGELLDQRNKLQRSGLSPFFSHVEIVCDKSPDHYLTLCRNLGIQPENLLMVGNSFKSDIAPALSIGAWAAHIPFHVTWQLEQTDEFDHPRLVRLKQIKELIAIL